MKTASLSALVDTATSQALSLQVTQPVQQGRLARRRVVLTPATPPAAGAALDLTVAAGVLEDLFGNATTAPHTESFTWGDGVVSDAALPKVVQVSVETGRLRVTFSEPPDLATVGSVSVAEASLTWGLAADGYTLESVEDLPVDEETGLLYARNRYYDPDLGRFISVDPLGYVDGPNLYQYALNNPVSFADPMGLCAECDVTADELKRFGKSIGRGFAGRGGDSIKGLWQAVTHPRETLRGAGEFVSDVLANPGRVAEGMLDSGNEFLSRLASPDPEVAGDAVGVAMFDVAGGAAVGGTFRMGGSIVHGSQHRIRRMSQRARRGDGHTARSTPRTHRRAEDIDTVASSGEAATLSQSRRSAGSAPWEAYLPEARRRVAESKARQGGVEAYGVPSAVSARWIGSLNGVNEASAVDLRHVPPDFRRQFLLNPSFFLLSSTNHSAQIHVACGQSRQPARRQVGK